MPRMMSMWLATGGAALAGATLTYVVTRPSVAPFAEHARDGWGRISSFVSRQSRGGGPFCAANRTNETDDGGGQSAFNEYRSAALKTLNDDEREFQEYLERLRHAKDRAEFDQFMADRKGEGVKKNS